MTEYLSPAWWCVLQTGLVACLGVAAACLLGRRLPGAAALAASAAATTILAVTVMIPAPMPQLALGSTWHGDGADSPRAGAASRALRDKAGVDNEGAAGVDVAALARRMLNSVGAGVVKPQAAWGLEIWVVGIGAAGAVVGLARFVAAMRFVRRLRLASVPVGDAATLALFADLGKRLGVRRTVVLRDSAEIASPAVIGWRRPVVLLPADRAEWTAEQLRAALAHELAHVVRSDFAWRAAASLTQAIHFFHPLVHWLTRRLALVQELAADEIAAAAAGGPAVYLRALSELAVRLDDQRRNDPTRLRAEPIVLPALSSHLMRRIAMLRSKEGSTADGGRSAWGVIAACLIATVGAGTMALRGAAGTVEPTPTENASAAEMFGRLPLDAPAMFNGNQGLCVVRIHELAQRPAFAPLIQLGNAMLSEQWQTVFKGDVSPTMRLETIEYMAGAITLKRMTTVDADGKGRGSSESTSFEEFVIRFVDEIEWRPWITEFMPGGEEIHDEGFAYVKLPQFQGEHLFVAERDARTLVIASNVERLRELAAGGGDPGASLSKSLASVDGGLAALAIDAVAAGLEARLEGATFTTDDVATIAAVKAIFLNVREIGVGFDLDGVSNESGLRVALTCADEAAAERLHSAMNTLLPMAKAFFHAAAAGPESVEKVASAADGEGQTSTAGEPSMKRADAEFWSQVVDHLAMEVERRSDGSAVLHLATTAPFPASIVTAQQVEVADAEAKPDAR